MCLLNDIAKHCHLHPADLCGFRCFFNSQINFYCVWQERTLSVCVYVSTSPTAARTGCCVMICTVKIVQLHFQREQR